MGKLYLNADNKLVVETDNGRINPDGKAEVEITGEETYTIQASDIALLLKIVNNQDTNTILKSFIFKEGFDTCRIISNEDTLNIIQEKVKELAECRRAYNKLYDKVMGFNNNRKLFWRPIKIED